MDEWKHLSVDLPSEVIYSLNENTRAHEEPWNTNHNNYKNRTLKKNENS